MGANSSRVPTLFFLLSQVAGIMAIVSLIDTVRCANSIKVFSEKLLPLVIICIHRLKCLEFKNKDWERIRHKHMYLECPKWTVNILTYSHHNYIFFFCEVKTWHLHLERFSFPFLQFHSPLPHLPSRNSFT